MTPIRTKDKLFLAVAVPLAAVAAYVYFWRIDAEKRAGELEAEHAALVEVDDYPMEKLRAENRLAQAQIELEQEKAAPRPVSKMHAEQDATLADRQSAVLDIFREHGLVVLRAEILEADKAGMCPDAIWRASCWRRGCTARLHRYTLDGAYPAVKRALDAFASGQMAVIVERVGMKPGASGRWTLEVWL